MTLEELIARAERYELSAIADSEHGLNNMLYAERADRKFRIAAALRSHAQKEDGRWRLFELADEWEHNAACVREIDADEGFSLYWRGYAKALDGCAGVLRARLGTIVAHQPTTSTEEKGE